MGFFQSLGRSLRPSNLGKTLKQIAPVALPIAASFIPGVGPAMGGLVSKAAGALFGGGGEPASAQAAADFMGPPEKPPDQTIPINGKPWYSTPGALGAIGSIGSGLLAYTGQRETNAANAAAAQRQMDFQAEQSSTAYQRGTADMRAAGLNPMLGYSQGGASSPAGASSTSGNALGAGASAALGALQQITGVGLTKAQTEQTQAQTDNIDADTKVKLAQEGLTVAQTSQSASTAKHTEQSIANLQKDLERLGLEVDLRRGTLVPSISEAVSSARQTAATAKAAEYDLSRAKAESEFYDVAGSAGKVLSSIGSAVSSARGIAGIVRGPRPVNIYRGR